MNVSRLSLGAFGVFLAIFFFVNNSGYPTRAAQIPLIFSTVVGLLSVALIVQEVIVSRLRLGLATSAGPTAGAEKERNVRGIAKAFIIYGLALLYVYAIGVVGYFIATALFMASSLFVVRGVSIRYAGIGVAALLSVIGLVFFNFLGLNMPALPSF